MKQLTKVLLVVFLVGTGLLGLPPALAAPGDIVFARQPGQATPQAVFPHWFHRIRFRCDVCHPAIFPMKVTNKGISMDKISAGEFCGKCHNGRVAWTVGFDTCSRCHTKRLMR